jgi:hypothetical protein
MSEVAHGADLRRHPEPVVITTLVRNQVQRGAVQEEVALQLRTGQFANEPRVGRSLDIGKEVDRRGRTTYTDLTSGCRPTSGTDQDQR